MTPRRTMLQMNAIVGATVAVVVFVLSVVLADELRLGARGQRGEHRAPHAALDTKALAAHGSSAAASTLILHCGQFPCLSREQMLTVAAAHLDVSRRTLAATVDSLRASRARVARR